MAKTQEELYANAKIVENVKFEDNTVENSRRWAAKQREKYNLSINDELTEYGREKFGPKTAVVVETKTTRKKKK